ncbi:hypothetical protein [uncultured Piscinibacter sp.]|uniref:hypothetical protein n=1 Tax=uncultured Piscinibacter sp. TaxID=1131835 RepID=UPI00260CCA9F|nr:hypothetical protein [uncultured Piscinibacter sp.]
MRQALSALTLLACAAAHAQDDPAKYLKFVEEHAANCVMRNATQIQVKNTHPTRRIRVWLDRYHMGVGTGDRSRSELAPGAEPEPLGCSRSDAGTQEWRVVRAQFVD